VGSRENNKFKRGIKLMLAKVLTFQKFNEISNYCSSNREVYVQIVNKINNYLDSFCESYIFENNEQSNQFLTLNRVKQMLNYSDSRSALNWCKENGVFVIHQGNAKVVSRVEFLLAFQKPLIEHLKRNHKNWKDRLSNYMKLNLNDSILSEYNSDTIETHVTTNYKPKSEIEKSFLKNIKEL